MLGLAIVAMAALATVGATSALATTPEWLNNGAAIVAPIAVKTSGTLLLADLKQKVELQCTGTGEDTVGPGKEGLTSTATATSCTNVGSTSCPTPSVAAQKLPWLRILKIIAAIITSEITQESGWQVTCAGIIKDTCTAAANVLFVEVIKTAAVVEESFVEAKNQNVATCSLGGKEGDIVGTFTVEALAGSGNSISVG